MNEKRYSDHNRKFRHTDAGIVTRCQGGLDAPNSYHNPPTLKHPRASRASQSEGVLAFKAFWSTITV